MWRRRFATFVTVAILGAVPGTGAQAAGGDAELIHLAPQKWYFAAAGGADDPGGRFSVALTARSETETSARDVVVVHDASSLESKVALSALHHDCTAEGMVVTCEVDDFYTLTDIEPFRIRSLKGAPIGVAGAIETRVTSSNAGSVTHTTQVYIGKPDLRRRAHEDVRLPPSDDGNELPPIVPAFGNLGEVEAPEGVVMRVSISEGRFVGERYRNCRYSPHGDSAYCAFPEPLLPGTAFRTDGPFQGTTDDCCWMEGAYSYHIRPIGNPPQLIDVRDYARGDGRVLGLEPYAPESLSEHGGRLEFASTGLPQADYSVDGLTLRGRIGEALKLPPPKAENLGPDDEAPGVDHVELMLPEGVVLGYTPEMPGDVRPCRYGEDEKTVVCEQDYMASLRVVIVEQVEGAEGVVRLVQPDGATDPDLTNNTASITVEVTAGDAPDGGDGGGDGGGGDGGGDGGSSVAGPFGSEGVSEGRAGDDGALASTGASGVLLLAGAGASAAVVGLVLLVWRHRRTRRIWTRDA